jgi:hypothetical protein
MRRRAASEPLGDDLLRRQLQVRVRRAREHRQARRDGDTRAPNA